MLHAETLAGDIEKAGLPVKHKRASGRIWRRFVAILRWTRQIRAGNLADTLIRGSADRSCGITKARVSRVKRFSLSVLAAGAALFFGPILSASAQQDGSVASYVVSIGGINVSNIDIRLATEGSSYQLDLSADVTGLAQVLAQGAGSVNSSGSLTATGLQAQRFYLETRTASERFSLQTAYSNGNAATGTVIPALADNPDRVAVSGAHRSGVNDPLAAFILRGSALDGALCNRTLRIYTGIERFDMPMSYVETTTATSARTGYQGPVVLCAMRYVPVSGHFESSEITQYLANSNRMLIWYMPLGTSGFFIPYRMLMGSSFGDISMVLVRLQ